MARFRSRSPARGPKRSRIANADEVTKEEWRTDAPCSTCPVQTGTYSGWDEYGVTKFYCSDCWRKYLHEKAVKEIMEAMPELSLGDDDVFFNSPAARSAIVGARHCSSQAYGSCARTAPMRS